MKRLRLQKRMPALVARRCCESNDLEPRMILQQQGETLTYHAGRADDAYFVLLHVYQILPERCNNVCVHPADTLQFSPAAAFSVRNITLHAEI